MKVSLKRVVYTLLLITLSIMTVDAKIISYSVPEGESLSMDYVVEEHAYLKEAVPEGTVDG